MIIESGDLVLLDNGWLVQVTSDADDLSVWWVSDFPRMQATYVTARAGFEHDATEVYRRVAS